MRTYAKILGGLVASSMLMASSALASFQVIQTTTTTTHGLDQITTVVQNGANALNRFGVVRVVKHGFAAQRVGKERLKGAVILLPGLGATTYEWTSGDAAGGADFENSIAAHLAKKNIDVYLYNPREAYLAPGACSSGTDCSVMATWGMQARLDDMAYIMQQVAVVHGREKPFLGGQSLGAMNAIMAANETPDAFAGLVLVDGTVYMTDPTLKAGYQQICDGLNAQIAGGGAGVYNDQLDPLGQALLSLDQTNPNGISPFPFFPPNTTNRQAYLLFLSTPSAGPPASIFPTGFILAQANLGTNSFTYSSENRLASDISSFTYYAANAEIRDVVCSLSGATPLYSHLGDFRQPILSFDVGYGFGPYMSAQLALFGSCDIQHVSLPNFGHVDTICTPDHDDLVDQPIVDFITRNR